MARRHYWQFLVTDEGNPIENAEITIYIAGSTDAAYVYLDEIGGTPLNVGPQTVTSRKGYFEFWVADVSEIGGYNFNQKFKLGWRSTGIAEGYIDYIDIFSTSVAEVDVTSSDGLVNKAVSNELARGWENHSSIILGVNGAITAHGMSGVDVAQHNVTIENDTSSKLVSNIMGNNWEGHANTEFDEVSDWVFTLSGSAPQDADVAGGPGNPHGIELVDITSSSIERNVLVSNSLVKGWQDHLLGVTEDHNFYSLVNGTRKYTDPVGYSDSIIIDTVGDNDFITKSYVIDKTYTQTIDVGDWDDNGDGTYSYVVVHSLNIQYPMIIVWDLSSNTVIQPVKTMWVSDDLTQITISNQNTTFVRIMT